MRPRNGSTALFFKAAPALVAAATAAVFLPSVRFEFVNWDDQPMLVSNPLFRGLDWAHVRWMFTTGYMANYQPLSWLSYALDYRLWGMNPFGFHLTNVVLHAVNAALFCLLARVLLGASLPDAEEADVSLAAVLAALLFALHPLRAESVAWVSERRDVLSGFFYLLTVLLYLSARKTPDAASARRREIASWSAYALSLSSKGIGVSLPITLLALDFYPLRRRLTGALLKEKYPYIGLALAAGLVGAVSQNRAGAVLSIDTSWTSRIAHAFEALCFYPWKSLVPTGLIPFYSLPDSIPWWHWTFVLSAAAVSTFTAAALFGRRRWPAATAAWVHYLGAAAPVVGLLRFGPQLAADRYSYLSCMAWPLLLGGELLAFRRGAPLVRRAALAFAAAALVAVSAAATVRQIGFWRDSVTLWSHALQVHPDEPLARNNLGEALAARGRGGEAIAQYRQAIELQPDYADARDNLGIELEKRGETAEALDQFWTALWFEPGSKDAHLNLALTYMAHGDRERARFLIERALEIDPGFSDARAALARLGP
ncbi:MAG: tetratricopeptide repeat protein [Elusimicrobiota bacterium]